MNTPATKNRATIWIVAVVALVVLGAGAVALATTRKSSSTIDVAAGSTKATSAGPSKDGAVITTGTAGTVTTLVGQVTFPVRVLGNALDVLPTKGSDPAIGKAFPELSGTSAMDGQPLTIANDGRPKLVLFVAHWCPHCQREVPVIQKWLDATKPKDFDVRAVSTGVDPPKGNYPPLSWLTKEKWSVPTLADSDKSEAAAAAGLTGYPYFVALDKKGNVVARASGELTVDQLNGLVNKITG